MHGYSFNIGDLLRIAAGSNTEYITSPADPEKHYIDSLRVVFRFWDGKQNVYVVTASDGITVLLVESDAELQEPAEEVANEPEYQTPEPYEVLKNFVSKIPTISLGYVFKVNRRLVAAHSLEEAIGMFRQQADSETIESVQLLERDCALIQNEIPLI